MANELPEVPPRAHVFHDRLGTGRSERIGPPSPKLLLAHPLVHVPHFVGASFHLGTFLNLSTRLLARVGTPRDQDEPERRTEEPTRPDHDPNSTHARASFFDKR